MAAAAEVLTNFAEFARDAAPAVGAVFTVLKIVLEKARDAKMNKDSCKELAERVAILAPILQGHLMILFLQMLILAEFNTRQKEVRDHPKCKSALAALEKILRRAIEFVDKYGNQSMLRNVAQASSIKTILATLDERLNSAVFDLMFVTNAGTSAELDDIGIHHTVFYCAKCSASNVAQVRSDVSSRHEELVKMVQELANRQISIQSNALRNRTFVDEQACQLVEAMRRLDASASTPEGQTQLLQMKQSVEEDLSSFVEKENECMLEGNECMLFACGSRLTQMMRLH